MKKLSLVVLLAVLACCKKEPEPPCMDRTNPDCPNYDPCHGVSSPSAGFLMKDKVGLLRIGEIPYVLEDSVFRGTSIQFFSEYTGSEYTHKWYIGSEVLTGYQVERAFKDVQRPNVITVHHVLEYPVDSTCLPTDDGFDSTSQSFFLIEYWNQLATFGTFRVANESVTDSFDFKIKMLLPDGTNAPYHPSIVNYESVFINFNNNSDSVSQGIRYAAVNTEGFFEGDGRYPSGSIKVNPNSNTVDIMLKLDGQIYYQKGRKIN